MNGSSRLTVWNGLVSPAPIRLHLRVTCRISFGGCYEAFDPIFVHCEVRPMDFAVSVTVVIFDDHRQANLITA